MISVIICSDDTQNLGTVKENIRATIGVDFEFLAIDNRFQKKGICHVYNTAAATARYDVLCFIHEDVLIHSGNWGRHLMSLLADETIGLVGVSGSVYKSAYPATWSACDQHCYRVNTIQHFKNYPSPVKSVINPSQHNFEEVAVLDGVFLATRKSIFELHQFDEKNFTGFHCYDLDFSLSIGTKYKLAVTYDILLEHFSEGNLNSNWFSDTMILHKKWQNILPKQTGKVGQEQKKRSNFIACRSFLQQALAFSRSKKLVLKYYLHLFFFYWKYNHLSFSKAVFRNLIKFSN